ncbi:hypothetical protein EVAR_44158_1 [Eumeta japonica]|uniref:Proteasome assembly chaperone 4 n=1 Tax=Eumeta variegata TaxID=151549 RepID=A0A4C1XND1_EUMVA|nr:hypothetical protein EVAR_44158_1 [Eumeta japonica]
MTSKVSSEKQIVSSTSAWSVHRFEIWSGDPIATVEVLRMKDSLLLWIGNGAAPCLEELALGMASTEQYTNGLATELLSGAGGTHSRSKNLAARLAKGLNKHVLTLIEEDVRRSKRTRASAVYFLRRCPNAETLSRHESPDFGAKGGLRMRSNADTTIAT